MLSPRVIANIGFLGRLINKTAGASRFDIEEELIELITSLAIKKRFAIS